MKQTTDYLTSDEVQNNTSWITAAPYISQKLDQSCYEYAKCRLSVNVIAHMTYNERRTSVQFSQRQVAVVTELPVDGIPLNEQKLTLCLAPPVV